jgi:hypothetical protein
VRFFGSEVAAFLGRDYWTSASNSNWKTTEDGSRKIAEIPGVLAYGATREEAKARVESLAHRVIAIS